MKEYKDERVLVLSIRSNRWNDRSISKKKANDENAYGYSTFVIFFLFSFRSVRIFFTQRIILSILYTLSLPFYFQLLDIFRHAPVSLLG